MPSRSARGRHVAGWSLPGSRRGELGESQVDAVAEDNTVCTRLRGTRYGGILPMAKLSMEELTSRSMSDISVVTS